MAQIKMDIGFACRHSMMGSYTGFIRGTCSFGLPEISTAAVHQTKGAGLSGVRGLPDI